jgi:hypothetical protein
MNDYVSKPFIPGKTLVNSPMSYSQVTYANSPSSGAWAHTHNYGYNRKTGSVYRDREAVLDALLAKCNQSTDGLITQAATSALAGVKRPEVSGLVALAEFRETVQSLIHPVNGALNWLKRNAPTKQRRKKKRKWDEVKATSSDVANQHLTIIFGIMPFISDIQGILKAIEAIEPVPVRMTSRGTASAVDTQTSSGEDVLYSDSAQIWKLQHFNEARRTVTCRAYYLYEASVDLQSALGLSVSDVPKAVWQYATLSFVVDWFANVGDFISALTPRSGITPIASGYTLTTVSAVVSHYGDKATTLGTSPGWSGSRSGGSLSRVTLAKSRVPCSLHTLVGIVPKQNMHHELLDTFKITAGISLITQKLQKLL